MQKALDAAPDVKTPNTKKSKQKESRPKVLQKFVVFDVI